MRIIPHALALSQCGTEEIDIQRSGLESQLLLNSYMTTSEFQRQFPLPVELDNASFAKLMCNMNRILYSTTPNPEQMFSKQMFQ